MKVIYIFPDDSHTGLFYFPELKHAEGFSYAVEFTDEYGPQLYQVEGPHYNLEIVCQIDWPTCAAEYYEEIKEVCEKISSHFKGATKFVEQLEAARKTHLGE